jgi:hypothetical protein
MFKKIKISESQGVTDSPFVRLYIHALQQAAAP